MLLIYLPKNAPRCQYVFDTIFKYQFAVEYRVTNDVTEFRNNSEEKINYSDSKIDNEFFIKASSFLAETDIRKQDIIVV